MEHVFNPEDSDKTSIETQLTGGCGTRQRATELVGVVRGEGGWDVGRGNERITDYTRATERDAVRSRTIAGGLWEGGGQ